MTNHDLFGNPVSEKKVCVRIYADEIQPIPDPITNEKWFYIGLLIEDTSKQSLKNLLDERFRNNYDKSSPFYDKNNKKLHWKEFKSLDEKNICSRWFEYYLNKQTDELYFYFLGVNDDKLWEGNFGTDDQFNNKYNRFFRAAVLYGLKVFFFSKYEKIIVKNVYHETGQQQDHYYFPWHSIFRIEQNEKRIVFENKNITFLGKDHKENELANFIQLTDCLLGSHKDIVHGMNGKSKQFKNYKETNIDKILTTISKNKKPSRSLIRFFPRQKLEKDELNFANQFYESRRFNYLMDKTRQEELQL